MDKIRISYSKRAIEKNAGAQKKVTSMKEGYIEMKKDLKKVNKEWEAADYGVLR
mgnify:CR=1 FL=1